MTTSASATAAREREGEDLLLAGEPVAGGSYAEAEGCEVPLAVPAPPPARVWDRIEATLRREGRIKG